MRTCKHSQVQTKHKGARWSIWVLCIMIIAINSILQILLKPGFHIIVGIAGIARIAVIAENNKKASHIQFICYVCPAIHPGILIIFAKFIAQTVNFSIPSVKSAVSANELRSKAISNYKLTRKISNRSNAGLSRKARECQM